MVSLFEEQGVLFPVRAFADEGTAGSMFFKRSQQLHVFQVGRPQGEVLFLAVLSVLYTGEMDVHLLQSGLSEVFFQSREQTAAFFV